MPTRTGTGARTRARPRTVDLRPATMEVSERPLIRRGPVPCIDRPVDARGALRRPHFACALAVVVALAALAPAAGAQKPAGLSSIPGPLPITAPDILIRADLLARGGDLPAARVLLNQVIEQFPDTGWARWGELGLGFLALARGRMVEARPYYEAASA